MATCEPNATCERNASRKRRIVRQEGRVRRSQVQLYEALALLLGDIQAAVHVD